MLVQCPECLQGYEVQESLIGKKIKCEICGTAWTVEKNNTFMKKCPACGEKILMVAKKCRFCGEFLAEDNSILQRKSYAVYIIFALLVGGLFGLHNFYARQYSAAFVKILLLILAFFSVLFFPMDPIWTGFLFMDCYFILWDIAYDPNIPTANRKKIFGWSPWFFSFSVLCILAFFVFLIFLIPVLF